MRYTRITLDVGVAIKAFHVVWNDKDQWNDIIIHLGDFHAFIPFFGSIEKFVTGSGLEIVYKAGLCTSESMNGLLSEKHYNR